MTFITMGDPLTAEGSNTAVDSVVSPGAAAVLPTAGVAAPRGVVAGMAAATVEATGDNRNRL